MVSDWYNELTNYLRKTCNYKVSNVGKCVFYKYRNGSLTICLHVDDLLVVTQSTPKSSLSWMEISFLPDRSKQSGYIKELLDTVEYDQTHPTPSTSDFFNTTDDPTIDYSTDSKRFKRYFHP